MKYDQTPFLHCVVSAFSLSSRNYLYCVYTFETARLSPKLVKSTFLTINRLENIQYRLQSNNLDGFSVSYCKLATAELQLPPRNYQ